MNKTLQLIVLTGFISACSQSVEVVSDFPEPVVEPLPLVVGVRYPTELTEFVHVEDPLADSEWTISLGDANLRMFRTVFGGMFTEVKELDADNAGDGAQGVDLIIEPNLKELEFALPEHSASDQYTVWLRYQLRLVAPNGKLIGNWRVTAYGQEDEGAMGMGGETAMEEATITALRDAAAGIIIGFDKAPGLAGYLQSGNNAN